MGVVSGKSDTDNGTDSDSDIYTHVDIDGDSYSNTLCAYAHVSQEFWLNKCVLHGIVTALCNRMSWRNL